MEHKFSRTELLIGQQGLKRLSESTVVIFGLGGVGSFVAEALVRAGIGRFKLVDFDKICITNINRQLLALHSTVGEFKVEVMRQRMLDINPEVKVETYKTFYTETEASYFFAEKPDYVIDAIDTVKSKVSLAKECLTQGIPFISSMGAGNRLNALSFQVDDISKTRGCPLAKAVRKLLRQQGITKGFKVVFSPEPPISFAGTVSACDTKECRVPGSISYVPSVAGLLMAGEVIKDLLKNNG